MPKNRNNYKRIRTIKDGIPFITVLKLNSNSGNIIYAMEKPDFKNIILIK